MNDDLSKKENLINGDIQGPGGYKCGKRLIEVDFFLSKPSLDEFQDIFIMEKLYNNIIIIIIKIHDLWGH